MRINGAVANEIDTCLLVATLAQAGDRSSLAAADRIAAGLLEEQDVDLSGDEALAVLACLEDPPDGLDDLRAVLSRPDGSPGRSRLGVFAPVVGLLFDPTNAAVVWQVAQGGAF